MTPTASERDPTGQATNRKKAARDYTRPLNAARKRIIASFRSIGWNRISQKAIVNKQDYGYEYETDEEELTALEVLIAYLIAQALLRGKKAKAPTGKSSPIRKPKNTEQPETPPRTWPTNDRIDAAAQSGAVSAVRDVNRSVRIAQLKGVLPPNSKIDFDAVDFINSQEYKSTVRGLKNSAFAPFKTLSAETSGQIMNQIRGGIKAKQSPRVIVTNIIERIEVAKSRVTRIVRTEVNRSFNNARMLATENLGKRTGLRSGVVHRSALMPTTRSSHAARHGNAYTVTAQEQWWDQGANRINCYCTVIPVLLDQNNQVVDQGMIETFREQKKFFDE